MAKDLIFDEKARQSVLKGVETLAKAVKTTLGPSGRNVIIEQMYGAPTVTKDGVSVARVINLEDPFENIGAQLIKEVSTKTNDLAGDGTTTATVLAESIYKEGLKNVSAGANPTHIQRGINKASKYISDELVKLSKTILTTQDIKQVATVSSNWDVEIGDIISDAIDKVGGEGIITVEESNGHETDLVVTEGLQFDNGYLSPYFVTDSSRMKCNLSDVYVLICEEKISSMRELIPVLEAVAKEKKPLLIIANEIDVEALSALVVNKNKGSLDIVAVKSPNFGDNRKLLMEDISVMTGGSVINSANGLKLKDTLLEDLGRVSSVSVDKDTTTLVNGSSDRFLLDSRVEIIKSQIETAKDSYDLKFHKDRLAKLTSGVGVIRVGATTESEMKEKKDRVDDALCATKSALEEGIVIGGGTALIRAYNVCKGELLNNALNDDERVGMELVGRAIEAPLRYIVNNSGRKGDVVIGKIQSTDDVNLGYNVLTDSYVDMFEAGVVDPKKVTRSALQHACSVSGLLLTTNCIISNHLERV